MNIPPRHKREQYFRDRENEAVQKEMEKALEAEYALRDGKLRESVEAAGGDWEQVGERVIALDRYSLMLSAQIGNLIELAGREVSLQLVRSLCDTFEQDGQEVSDDGNDLDAA